MERHFFVCFAFTSKEGHLGFRTIGFSSEGYPNEKKLIDYFKKDVSEVKNIHVISICEMKKEDFDVFFSETE